MSDIVLIGCVQTKRDEPAPLVDLYDSPLWRRRRAYAEESGRPWAILSAKYGCRVPRDDRVCEPYDLHISDLPRIAPSDGSTAWSKNALLCQVLATLRGRGTYGLGGHLEHDNDGPWTSRVIGGTIEIHAGQPYVDLVRWGIEQHGAWEADAVDVAHPVEGLQIGEQLKWYNDRLGGRIAEQRILL